MVDNVNDTICSLLAKKLLVSKASPSVERGKKVVMSYKICSHYFGIKIDIDALETPSCSEALLFSA